MDKNRTRVTEDGLILNTEQMQVFDQFYHHEMVKGLKQVRQQLNHEKQAFNKNNPSEFTMERLQNLENKVKSEYERDNVTDAAFSQVTEIQDTFLKKDQRKSQIEVLRGRFNLRINER